MVLLYLGAFSVEPHWCWKAKILLIGSFPPAADGLDVFAVGQQAGSTAVQSSKRPVGGEICFILIISSQQFANNY